MLSDCGGEKTLESPLDCKEIKSVNPKRNQPRIFIGSTYVEIEVPVFWPPDAKNWLFRKDSDAGKNWRQEEKWMTEDVMVGWYLWLSGHEFEQTLEIVKDREAWHATVHGVTKSLTWLSNWTTSHMPKLLSKGWFLLTTYLISEYTPGVGWEISNYPLLIP